MLTRLSGQSRMPPTYHLRSNRHRLLRLAGVLLAASISAIASAQTTPPAPKSVAPLEVELTHSLNSDTLHAGDEILAKLRTDWTDGSCHLTAAAVLHGRVEQADHPANRPDQVAISFHYLCHDEPKQLIWLALLAPEPVDGGHKVLKQALHNSSFGEGGGLGRPGNTIADFAAHSLDMSGRQNPSFPAFTETAKDRKKNRPDTIKTGQVWNLPHLTLAVGAGPEDSTILSSTEQHAKLQPGSLLVLLPASAAVITTASPHAPTPLEVELTRSLNSETLHLGDTVMTKVKGDWTDGTCKLANATVLHATVASLDLAARHTSIALSFHYTCDLTEKTQKLIWLSLLAPEPADDGHRLMRAGFRSPSFGEGGGLGDPGNTQANPVDMSGRQNAVMPLSYQDSDTDRKGPNQIKTGQVWKLSHLKLDVGKGPDSSTVLSSTEKTLHLPIGSILVLLPESAAYKPATPVVAPTAPKPQHPIAVKLPPELAPCRPPSCTTFASPITAPAAPAPVQTIPLDRLGYGRLKAAEMLDLDFGAAVAFLGNDQLLFTFNPHTLVPREPGDRPEDHPHMVRAVLFDRRSGRAERNEEWRVPDTKQYLWVVDGEHVVVHDGDRLRWLGPGLLETQSLALGGPLAWLQMSPDRRHYAVAVIHELHTPKEHAALAQSDAAGPEEQVRVRFLDGRLEREGEEVGSSRALPPVLLSTGRVQLWRTGSDTYYLRETPWATPDKPTDAEAKPTPNPPSGDPPPHTFARTQSSCVPRLRSLTGDLLLEEGCRTSTDDHWIKVFHQDGAPVLETVVHWREFSLLSAESADAGLFTITTAEMNVDHVRNSPFHGADLARETVRLHRAADGRELFCARLRDPLPARQPVALSPAGDELAVIDGDTLLLYATPTPAQSATAQSAQR